MNKALIFALTIVIMITAAGCKEEIKSDNPLLTEWTTDYGVPPFDQIKPEHYLPAIKEGISLHQAEIDSILKISEAPSFENTIEALDRAGKTLRRASTTFSLVNSADGNDQLRSINLEISPLLTAHYDNINLNEALFARIEAVYDNRERAGLDDQQKRLTKLTYDRFVRAGALLDASGKDQLRKINERLSTLSVTFGNNLLSGDKAYALIVEEQGDVYDMPSAAVSAAFNEAKSRGHDGKWAITLSKTSMIPFLTYSRNRTLREELYRAYLDRGTGGEYDNREIINETVKLRLEKARLLGYGTFAEYTLANNMAGNPGNVYDLLDRMWQPALEMARGEVDEMKAIKATEGFGDDFASWDWWYYANKVRQNKYSLDENKLSEYFSLSNVTDGIFQLCNRLWGITFRPVVLPVYNSECVTYEVLDINNNHLGILYMDFHPRDGSKGVGAWCGSFRRQSYNGTERVAPVVTIVCNFTRPGMNNRPPSLLNLDEVNTYFHEFGHALHNLFSDVRYEGLGGGERDFVELPSQIMENWAFEPAMLRMYARHYQTDEIIPDDLIQSINRASLFNQGFETTELVAASYSDMDIHNITEYAPFDVEAFERESLTEKRGLIPEIEPRYRYPYFKHIFNGGYSAGYYGYLWAEVLDKDAYEAFVETGDIFNKQVALAFREQILSRGGSEDGMTLYRNFRGTDPSVEPLLLKRGLIKERTTVINDEE